MIFNAQLHLIISTILCRNRAEQILGQKPHLEGKEVKILMQLKQRNKVTWLISDHCNLWLILMNECNSIRSLNYRFALGCCMSVSLQVSETIIPTAGSAVGQRRPVVNPLQFWQPRATSPAAISFPRRLIPMNGQAG